MLTNFGDIMATKTVKAVSTTVTLNQVLERVQLVSFDTSGAAEKRFINGIVFK